MVYKELRDFSQKPLAKARPLFGKDYISAYTKPSNPL
jgi:hypothetical protein